MGNENYILKMPFGNIIIPKEELNKILYKEIIDIKLTFKDLLEETKRTHHRIDVIQKDFLELKTALSLLCFHINMDEKLIWSEK